MAWEFSVLVVANVTATSDELLDALRERADRGACSFTLVMPASGAEARERLQQALSRMHDAGLEKVSGSVGDPDPVVAVMEVWDPMQFDEIMVSTLSKKTSRWLRRDLVRKVEGLGLPVTAVLPRQTIEQGVTDSDAFRSGIIGGGG